MRPAFGPGARFDSVGILRVSLSQSSGTNRGFRIRSASLQHQNRGLEHDDAVIEPHDTMAQSHERRGRDRSQEEGQRRRTPDDETNKDS